ncbi:MAG: T9SS type A sorting domain-containing protein [Bacteroidia bacterium]
MKKQLLNILGILCVTITLFNTKASAQCTGGVLDATIVPTTTIQLQNVPNLSSYYYNFVATQGVTYMFTYCSSYGAYAGVSSYDTQITINDNLGNYAGGYNDDFCGVQSYLEWICPANGTYEALPSLSFCATSTTDPTTMAYQIVAPANDPCSNATLIGVPSTNINNTTYATAETVLTCGPSDGTSGGVWYAVVGDGNQYTASLCTNGQFDTRMRVYSGSCSNLFCEAGNEDFCSTQSQVTWCAVNGTTYYILVHGNGAAFGAFTLNMSEVAVIPPGIGQSAFSYCGSGNITLNASGYSVYNWSPPSGLNTTSGSTVIASPSSTTTYTVVVTDVATGCPAYNSATVTVFNVPTVAAVSGSAAVCSGSATTLTGSGASTYDWQPGSLNGTTVTVNPLNTTTYTVTGTSIDGCTDTGTVTVIANPLPPVDATSSAPDVCIGSFVTLNAAGAITYNWMPGNNNNPSYNVTPTSNTTYTLTGTDGNGCVNTDTLAMIVNPLPTITATASPDTVCTGNADTLTGFGGVSYVWSNGDTTTTSIVAPSSLTTYTVTGTDTNGCANTGTVTVYALLSGPVTATAAYPAVCSGSPNYLSATGASNYSWNPGNMSGSSIVVSPATTTTYTVTGSTSNGCVKIDSLVVTVNQLPPVTGSASDYIFCAGAPSTLTATGASTYTWSPGNISGNPVTVNPATTTTYTATGTDANGCSDTANVTLTIYAAPSVVASAAPIASCSGSPVTMNASGASTYNWQPGNLNGSSITVTPSSPTTYTVTGTDANGCTDIYLLNVSVASGPNIICYAAQTNVCTADMDVLLYGTPAGGSWSGPGVTGGFFDPSAAGNGTHVLTYSYTDSNGCTNTGTTTIVVSACVSVNEISGLNGISFYPNPNDGSFTINVASGNIQEMKMEIIDLQGRVVYAEMLNGIDAGFTKSMSIEGIANGAYYIRFTSSNASLTEKLMIQK